MNWCWHEDVKDQVGQATDTDTVTLFQKGQPKACSQP